MSFLRRLQVSREGDTIPNRWINNDIKPIERGRRTWGFWAFHNFWVLINSNISSYMTGSSLIALGLTWWQALIAIIVGDLLSTLFVVLNSTPGAYYHIGFPIVNRYIWGMYGSQFVIWNRILLSLVWYSFQAWIGGECLYVCLQAIWPNIATRIPNHLSASTGTTTAYFVAYIIFMVISLPFIYIRPHKLKLFFYISSTTILVFEVVLLIWSLATMGSAGFGNTISGKTLNGSSTGWAIAHGIISTIGSIAAGILNQNDYARFSIKPMDAVRGQLISFPLYSIICSVIGILVTAATQQRYGEAYWSLPNLLSAIIENGGSKSRAAAFFAALALVVSQIGVNVPGNALSGGFDLAATFPRFINIRRGAYLTALLSIACNPWKLVNTATIFLSVLSSYAVFLGPMTGLMIAGYYLVHRQKINVDDLFVGSNKSIYWFTLGVNWRAIVAWALGVFPSLPGFVAAVNTSVVVSDGWMHVYYICFLSGFAISAFVFVLLHTVFPANRVKEYVRTAPAPHVLQEEFREKWDLDVMVVDSSEPEDISESDKKDYV